METNKQYAVANAGVNGGNATCLNLQPQGGLTFSCRDCNMTGYQPFAGEQRSLQKRRSPLHTA